MAGETIDGRRLLGAVGVVVVVVAVLAGLARLAGGTGGTGAPATVPAGDVASPRSSDTSTSDASSTTGGSSGSDGGAATSSTAGDAGQPADVARPGVRGDGHEIIDIAPPEDLEAARTTAGAFAVAYSSYRWDEPADAPLERARPLLTPEAADALAVNSGASGGRAEIDARKEVADATVDAVLTEGYAEDRIGFTVVVVQRITSLEGDSEQLISYHVTVVRSAQGGWLVAQVGVQ